MRYLLILLYAAGLAQTVPPQLSGLSTSTDPLYPMSLPPVPLPGASYVDTYHPNGADFTSIQRLPLPSLTCGISNWSNVRAVPDWGVAYLGGYWYIPHSAGVSSKANFTKVTTAATSTGGTVLTFTSTAPTATNGSRAGGLEAGFGFAVTGTGIPAGTTVSSFTATTVTLSAAVTADIGIGVTITFSNPPPLAPWVGTTKAELCALSSIIPSYSQRQAWNSDQTRFLVIARSPQLRPLLYRTGPPITFEKELNNSSIAGNNASETWDKTNPDLIHYTHSVIFPPTFETMNVVTNAITTVHAFSECPSNTGYVRNGGNGNPSADQRYWAYFCQDYTTNAQTRVIVYDKVLNQVVTQRDTSAICGGTPPGIDWIGVSPSGKYISIAWIKTLREDTWTTCSGVELFDRASLTSLGMIFSVDGHNDVGYDVNGEEVFVGGPYANYTSNEPNNKGWIVYVTKLADVRPGPHTLTTTYVKRYFLPCSVYSQQVSGDPYAGCTGTAFGGGTGYHISGRATENPATRGWFLMSLFSDKVPPPPRENSGWGKSENIALYIDTNQPTKTPIQFRRISRNLGYRENSPTSNTAQCTSGHDYFQEPHTTVNRDFTKILFGSSWLKQCSQVNSYTVDLTANLAASGGCPNSNDDKGRTWLNTCFVSKDGDDTAGTGTWAAPLKTIGAAHAVMTANSGASIVVRGGRYTNSTADGLYEPVSKCNEAKPCWIRSYPGEVVIVDGSSWMVNRGWLHSSFAAADNTPAWSGDMKAGYLHISGIRFENFPSLIVSGQGDTDGLEFRSVRINGPGGFAFQKCTNCAIHGSQVNISGWARTSGGQSAGLACGGVTPNYGSVPWLVSSTNYQTPYYDLVNTTPTTTAVSPNGCVDLKVQDSVFSKRNTGASDLIGMETSTRILLERVKLRAPWTQMNNEGWSLWGTAGTDAADLKGTAFLGRDLEIRGGKAGLKLWHSSDIDRALILSSFETQEAGMAGMTFLSQSAASVYEWPVPTNYRAVRYAFNDPLTNDAVVVVSRAGSGMGVAVDLPVTFAGIPGCTGINGSKLVKRIYHGGGDQNTFAIKNMDGSKFTCPDTYDLTQHAFHVLEGVTATFRPASTEVTATGLAAAVYLHDRIRFTTTGTLPPELTANVDYWIVYRSGTTVHLSSLRGGTPITFSAAGSGTHTAIVTDERTSYAGTMALQPYVQSTNHLSSLARNGSAVNMGGGYDGPAASVTWKLDNSVAAALGGAQAITHTLFLTAMPRVVMTESSATMAVEYFDDIGTLAVGTPVYFRESCKLPTGLEKDTPYYIVAADAAAKTIQVSAVPGGGAIAPTGLCGQPYYWLYTPGFTSTKVSLGNNLLAAGDTVRLVTDDGATPVYPLVKGNTYYIDSISSGDVGGVPFRWATIKNAMGDPAPISFSQYPMYPDSYFEKEPSTGGAPVPAFRISAFTTNGPSANNWYWSTQTDRAFCALSAAHGGTDAWGTCAADQAALDAQQVGSTLGGANPALDYSRGGRATALTPAAMSNRGYYAGTDTVEAGSTGAVLRWRAPEAGDSCTVGTYRDAGLTELAGTQVSGGGERWRSSLLGPLSPSTSYWYKIQCGYDVMAGQLTTKAAPDGTGTLGVELPAAAGTVAAALETSLDGIDWTSGPVSNCAPGCSVASAALSTNQAVWYRWKRLDGAGATLRQSEPRLTVVR